MWKIDNNRAKQALAATMLNAVTDDIAAPAFRIRLDTHELAEANAAARKLWGIGEGDDLPRAIDPAMPALQDLLNDQASPATEALDEFKARLVFWTERGAQRLACRYSPSQDGTSVVIVVDEPATPAPSSTAGEAFADPGAEPAAVEERPAATVDLRTMAHELRTPIGAIIALADMIDQEQFGPLGDPRYREYARDIRDSAHLALNIVAGALEHDAGDETILLGGISEIEPDTLLRKARRSLRLNAQSAGLSIDVDTAPDLPLLLANPPALTQILLNLTANAIKFTPPGGQILLRAATTQNGGLEIFVADTGIGMTEYEASVLVEPTSADIVRERADDAEINSAGAPAHKAAGSHDTPPTRGHGIGFTLVRRLAAAMGAQLHVHSERGVGTRVVVTFPPSRVIPRPPAANGA